MVIEEVLRRVLGGCSCLGISRGLLEVLKVILKVLHVALAVLAISEKVVKDEGILGFLASIKNPQNVFRRFYGPFEGMAILCKRLKWSVSRF